MMSPTSIACDGRITSQLGVPQGQRSAYLEPNRGFENADSQNYSVYLNTSLASTSAPQASHSSPTISTAAGTSGNQENYRSSRSGRTPLSIATALTSMSTPQTSNNFDPAAQHANAATTSSVPEQLTQTFPCSNPVNPHMRSAAARLQTFRDRSEEWQAHRIAATPERMAQAGLFYLGERDRVKCWYCNGGLQNWDRFDDPWFEHAKWFPTCEHVLRNKGPEFIANVSERFPNLNRPVPIYHAASPVTNVPQAMTSHRFSPSSNSSPQIIDPREQRRVAERRVVEEMESSPFVSQARLIGFSDDEIRTALLRRFEGHSASFTSVQSLVEEVIAAQEANEFASVATTRTPNQDTPSASTTTNLSPRPSEYQSLKQELERLKEMSLCKKCFQSKASVVLLPCGHLVACSDCSREISSCPLCGVIVCEAVHCYLV